MITLAQIQAETGDALLDEEIQVLELLVKQAPVYNQAIGRWPDLHGTLEQEQTVPTIKTQALRAVLTLLGRVPTIVVESQGSADEPSFYSTGNNWNQLALEVLNVLYDLPVILGNQSFALVQRTISDLTLEDESISSGGILP